MVRFFLLLVVALCFSCGSLSAQIRSADESDFAVQSEIDALPFGEQVNQVGDWTWPGGLAEDLREHLEVEHGIDTGEMTFDEMVEVHNGLHEGVYGGRVVSRLNYGSMFAGRPLKAVRSVVQRARGAVRSLVSGRPRLFSRLFSGRFFSVRVRSF